MKTLQNVIGAVALLCFVSLAPAAVTVVEAARVHTATQVALNGGTNGCVVSGASVTTGTTPSVITCVGNHNLVTGDQVQITGIVGTTTDNVTAFVNVLSATTFAIYNNADLASTHGIIGTGTYSSGGYVTEATDISALTSPWTLRLRVEALTAATNVLISVQDSVDGFVADIKTLAVYNLTGLVTNTQGAEVERTFRDFTLPSARVGVTNGRVRVLIQSITAGGSVTTSLFIQ